MKELEVLRKVTEFREGYLNAKRFIFDEIVSIEEEILTLQTEIEKLKLLKDNMLIDKLTDGDSIRIDMSHKKIKIKELLNKLAFYGLVNKITYEEYIINCLFYFRIIMEKVIVHAEELTLSFKGCIPLKAFMKLRTNIYEPKLRTKADGTPRLLMNRVKSFENWRNLKKEGVELWSEETPNGQKWMVFEDAPRLFIDLKVNRKDYEFTNGYYMALVQNKKIDNLIQNHLNLHGFFIRYLNSNPNFLITHKR